MSVICFFLICRQSDAIRFDLEQLHANAERYNETGSLIVRQSQMITSLALKSLANHDYSVVSLEN